MDEVISLVVEQGLSFPDTAPTFFLSEPVS
jgi:hypothetical protein